MARVASFYSSERVSPRERIARELANDPRAALVASMMSPNDRPAYGGIGEGLARVGSSIAGALLQKKLNKEKEGREKGLQDTLARALMGEQIGATGAEQGMGGGVSMQPIERTPNTPSDMAAILAGNPDTAMMGMDMRLQDIARQQQMADEQRRAQMEQQTWQQRFAAQQQAQQQVQQAQFEQQRQLRGIPQATAPVPGRDVPLPQEVFDQQLELLRAENEAKAAAKGIKLTEAQKELDRSTAKELMPFVVGGGFADTQKGLEQLRLVEGELEKGGITGTAVGMTPDFLLAPFNQRSVDAQNMVEEVVQRNLRTILGAQFTEKEGQRLIARAYNPHLTEKRNLRRVRALRQSIEQAARAKQEAWEYLQQNGTLKGFQGKVWGLQDFEAAVDAADTDQGDGVAGGAVGGAASGIDALVNKYRSR